MENTNRLNIIRQWSGVCWLLFVLVILAPLTGFCQHLPVEAGVSYRLALDRSKRIHGISYDLQFRVPAAMDQPVTAKETLGFDLEDTEDSLQVDWNQPADHIKSVNINGEHIAVIHSNEHLLISPAFLRQGKNLIQIDFIAGNLPLNRNPDFLYTLLVPDKARSLFPCFDQPDLKAVFTLTITVPETWKAITNAPLKDSATDHGRTTCHYNASDTISTYLFAFAAGRFQVSARKWADGLHHLYYRETDSAKLASSIPVIFDLHEKSVRFMEQYTNIPFPFRQLDFIAVPDFQFGGMEHAGAIYYNAGSLFLDSSATREQRIERANVIAHETAHMWFGDLVTMRWFDDVWMKEVFANGMADKIADTTQEDNNYDLQFLTTHFPSAYSIDRTQGAHAIRQTLHNLNEAGSLYGNIIYHKAPIMMRQLELLMGAAQFHNGLREYLSRFSFGNASWPELIGILDAYTPIDLKAWNATWVNEPGRPQLSYELKTADNKITGLTISQQTETGKPKLWPQVFEIALVYPDSIEQFTLNMNMQTLKPDMLIGKPSPRFILFNSGGEGYGVFPIDKRGVASVNSLRPSLMRGSAYINEYENMLKGRSISATSLLEMDMEALTHEKEDLNLNVLIDQVASIFWKFITPSDRNLKAPAIERLVWEVMQQAETNNRKKELFHAYVYLATTKTAQDTIYQVWKTKRPPTGVRLSEDDYTILATALAVRNYRNYRAILNEQMQRIQNPDRKLRFTFLLPALSNSTKERDAFFASLKLEKNRQKESWVLAALSYLHHPLRAAESEKYIPASLALLEEIQRTGDIFFPQSWIRATLSAYQSKTAADIVRTFLKDHPHLNPSLKAKILQAADNLFRAQYLVK